MFTAFFYFYYFLFLRYFNRFYHIFVPYLYRNLKGDEMELIDTYDTLMNKYRR